MKLPSDIKKWGRIKPYFDKTYNFNTLDVETIEIYYKNDKEFKKYDFKRFHSDIEYRTKIIEDNDLRMESNLFLLGYIHNNNYSYTLDKFFDVFHSFIINSIQNKKDILTWTRYDNTYIFKLILSQINNDDDIKIALLNVGKISPIYTYKYKNFDIEIVNIIKDSMILKLTDLNGRSKTVTIYNLKNLYDTDLQKTAINYGIEYYSKLGEEFHIIDKDKFYSDNVYRDNVILANKMDNAVLKDISRLMLSDFKSITGNYPKTIFTNGSLARSYQLSHYGIQGSKALNFNSLFSGRLKQLLLEYSMTSYHGGKIDSYVLGYFSKAKIIDITSAYPYAMTLLPKMKNVIIHSKVRADISKYFYAFIFCEIEIKDKDLIHPIVIENPINKSNISPYGYFNTVITKIEYDYLIEKGCKVKVKDFVAIEHEEVYPYKDMIELLFNKRMETTLSNPSLSQMFKIILNSLYGITYELTDVYKCENDNIIWDGWRSGDFFNPLIASYITAITRTNLSRVSHDIILNGGKVLLNMTDSVIYTGAVKDDSIFSDKKTLGKFEKPKLIKDIYILGSGRYEFKDEFTGKYTIKSRGFNVNVKDKSFYGGLDLTKEIIINHKTFVTNFKASTKKYSYEEMGYLIDDKYNINPFNLGGKRVVINKNVNLNIEYTDTKPVYLERGLM
jgi:hypothetical protein